MPGPRSLVNVVLLLLVAALAALVYLRPGTQTADSTSLTRLDPAQVQSIRIDNDRGRIELVRHDGGWQLREPDLPADAFQAKILLNLLNQPSQRQYPLAEIDPADIGLDPPRLVLHYDDAELRLGGTEPLQDLRYVQYGDTVHLIEDRVLNLLGAGASDLVSRRLVPAGTELQRLALPEFTLARTDTGGWAVKPDRPDISADRLQRLVDTWRTTQALWVGEDKGGPLQGEVELTFADGERIRYGIRRSEADFVLVREKPGLAYHLGTQQAGRLLELDAGKDANPAP
ncbi:hypothetical protein TspCOW1_27520 [Thiohalobacter sp. COW1]|uniref:DUF4340 domain-containing protein n=1 Tax=Thiohalobacter sp. COW1 TaxID=2795687 RepID=UPI001915E8FC|nr:DUF4340 domain-containing protein [Thiohalobacter sp. COW1]BCO32649.1 hypothetical protein TspCOW1_27520 [Thiohalobacter sp. COW1]